MYKLLVFIYQRLQRLRILIKKFFLYILPNVKKTAKKEIVLKSLSTLVIDQLTICTGEGIIEIGEKCSFGYKLGGFHKNGNVELQARYKSSRIKIGNNVATNNNVFVCAANSIEIEDNTLIGQNVAIMDFEAHGIEPLRRRELGEIGSVRIGRNVWIGNNVVILKNTYIGENTIVAAGAVVSGVFPSNVIIGGIPAKEIKKL